MMSPRLVSSGGDDDVPASGVVLLPSPGGRLCLCCPSLSLHHVNDGPCVHNSSGLPPRLSTSTTILWVHRLFLERRRNCRTC